jgi:hypothetical protein
VIGPGQCRNKRKRPPPPEAAKFNKRFLTALLTFGSFVLGAIEAYVFGWYVGALFGALYNT